MSTQGQQDESCNELPLVAELHKVHEAEEHRLHEQHEAEEGALHEAHQHEEELVEKEEEKHLAHIQIDGKNLEISKGKHTVAQLKKLGGVADAYVLLEEVDGRLVPLDDNATLTIKGCEVFESMPQSGGSS